LETAQGHQGEALRLAEDWLGRIMWQVLDMLGERDQLIQD
jgi:hypothetical protein